MYWLLAQCFKHPRSVAWLQTVTAVVSQHYKNVRLRFWPVSHLLWTATNTLYHMSYTEEKDDALRKTEPAPFIYVGLPVVILKKVNTNTHPPPKEAPPWGAASDPWVGLPCIGGFWNHLESSSAGDSFMSKCYSDGGIWGESKSHLPHGLPHKPALAPKWPQDSLHSAGS